MDTPQWAMTIAFWLHMLATVTWLGGQAALSLLVFPAGRKALAPEDYYNLITAINKRMRVIAWLSLAILAGTGLMQLTVSENYQGFVSVNNTWGAAILVKHVVFGLIVALSAYETWELGPNLENLALLRSRGKSTPEELEKLSKKERFIINLHLVLSVVVLLLTSVARVS